MYGSGVCWSFQRSALQDLDSAEQKCQQVQFLGSMKIYTITEQIIPPFQVIKTDVLKSLV